LLTKQFAPSKTAQNGLNFVTKDEEANLCQKQQNEEILNVFKLIYIFINEDYSNIPDDQLISNLTNNIYPKLGIESLSKYFFKCFSRISILKSHFEKIFFQ
jgi:hypothetical protein